MLYLFIAAYAIAGLYVWVASLLSRWLAFAFAAIGFPLLIYATWIEPRSVQVTHLEIPLAGLSHPVKALVIADPQPNRLHWSQERLEAVFARRCGEARHRSLAWRLCLQDGVYRALFPA